MVVQGVKVTALDANHCPGSAMFLFEQVSGGGGGGGGGDSGSGDGGSSSGGGGGGGGSSSADAGSAGVAHLHVGDFRFDKNMQLTLEALLAAQQVQIT